MRIDWNLAATELDPVAASAAVAELLEENRLLSMATVSPDGTPWAHNVYFCYDAELNFYFLTRPGSRHAANLANSAGQVAATVADSTQDGVPGTRRGLQFRGECRRARGEWLHRAASTFVARFPATGCTAIPAF